MSIFEQVHESGSTFLNQVEFLIDEVGRCYRDLERLEVENERLRNQRDGLMDALFHKEWQSLRQEYLERTYRKWRAR